MMFLNDYTTYLDSEIDSAAVFNRKYRGALQALSGLDLHKVTQDDESNVLVLPYALDSSLQDSDEWVLWDYSEYTKNGQTHQELRTRNLVGFIGHNNTNIAIGSRFSSKQNNNISKDYFLLYLLQKTLGISLFESLKSNSGNNLESALDFLLLLFPAIFKKALSQGMFKQYVRRSYNDANIRGVIDVPRHIRYNIPANGKVAYNTREFSYDNPITQLIRHTIEYLRRHSFGKSLLTGDAVMRSFVQQIIQATPSYVANQRQQIIVQNLRPIAHPLYTQYAMLQQLCVRILRYEKISYSDKESNKIHGVLIDMNWLWEEYVAQILSEKTSLGHYTRKNAFNLLKKEDGEQFQKVIPDYFGVHEGENIVADAKYMFLNNSDQLKVEKAMAVYYKTIMYMYRFNSKTGLLLYPYKPQSENPENEIAVVKYDIVETDGKIYKIGLMIPQNDSLTDFVLQIQIEEDKFAKTVSQRSGPT